MKTALQHQRRRPRAWWAKLAQIEPLLLGRASERTRISDNKKGRSFYLRLGRFYLRLVFVMPIVPQSEIPVKYLEDIYKETDEKRGENLAKIFR